MKKFIPLMGTIVLFLGTACATVEVETPEMKIKTSTLWKDIEGASAQTEDVVLELNSSKSQEEAKAMLLACVLFPDMPACQGD